MSDRENFSDGGADEFDDGEDMDQGSDMVPLITLIYSRM